MAGIDKVRIIVAGDSGVGKTSLVHLIAHNSPVKSPSWTVGCSVEVKLHEYKEGTPSQKTYFLEFWDVGGTNSHINARPVFYHPTHGIILVHDLTNKKSQSNLKQWLSEIMISQETAPPDSEFGFTNKSASFTSIDTFDAESSLGLLAKVPILIIGTKLDLAEHLMYARRLSGTLAEELQVDEIVLCCKQPRSLAAGTSNAVKLTRFFDKVIENKYYSRDNSPFGESRRKFVSTPPNIIFQQPAPRFYHDD